MKILVYSINTFPELTGIGKYTGEMVDWLSSNGHEIHVISAPPYYPDWKVHPPYKTYLYAREKYSNITTYRCPLWVPTEPTGLKRILHLASFALSSLPILLFNIRWKPDVILVIEPTFFCAPAGLLISKACRMVSWLHIQDFEVDAAFDIGLLSGKHLRKSIRCVEGWLLQRFDRVSTISDKMMERLEDKGCKRRRCFSFPNWVDTDSIHPVSASNPYRDELGLSKKHIVALYSGNMGNKQGLDILATTARLLRDRSDIHFVFCGNGSGRHELVELCRDLANVTFMNLQPPERLNDLLNLADIHLLPQRSDAADLVMPSKLTGMLASGRPVIAMASSGTEIANVMQPCGIAVPPGNADAFSTAVLKLADNSDLRRIYGQRARQYAKKNLDQNVVLAGFEQELKNVVLKKKTSETS